MSSSGAVTLGDIADRLPMLEVSCSRCGRCSRLRIASVDRRARRRCKAARAPPNPGRRLPEGSSDIDLRAVRGQIPATALRAVTGCCECIEARSRNSPATANGFPSRNALTERENPDRSSGHQTIDRGDTRDRNPVHARTSGSGKMPECAGTIASVAARQA